MSEEIKNIWTTYDNVMMVVERKEKELKEADNMRSDVVKRLLAANGGKKLLTRDGKEFTIMVRGDNHYIRTGKAGRPPKAK